MSESILYMTCETVDEGERIGSALVAERLVACVNMLPGMRSMYWWQGKVEHAQEVVLIAKTRSYLVEKVTDRVKALHSYDVPCVVAISASGGNPEFLRWIAEETGGTVR